MRKVCASALTVAEPHAGVRAMVIGDASPPAEPFRATDKVA